MLRSAAGYRRGFRSRLHEVRRIVDHRGKIALVRAAEIVILPVFAIAGVVDRRTEILRPQTAGAGNRRNPWIAQPDRRQCSDVVGMVVTQLDRARRHAASRKDPLSFPEGRRSSPGVRRVDRHVGHNRTGAFADPGPCQPHDVGTLRHGQTAAGLADEDHDRAVGLRYRDRMTLTIIVGNARGDDFTGRIVACPQHH